MFSDLVFVELVKIPATVKKAFELLSTSQRALIWLSIASRAVDSSDAIGQKRNLASGESQYFSRKGDKEMPAMKHCLGY